MLRFNINTKQAIIFCMLVFICVGSCNQSKIKQVKTRTIPGSSSNSSRQTGRDKFVFPVAKRINRKDNYSETFISMQNEKSPSSMTVVSNGYENYKLLSIKTSCFDDQSSSISEGEILSDGQKKKIRQQQQHAKYKKILQFLQNSKNHYLLVIIKNH